MKKLRLSRLIAPGLAAASLMSAAVLASPLFTTQAAAQPAPSAPAAKAPASAAANAPAPDTSEAGKEVFNGVCGGCHELAVATGQKKSRDAWQATVNRMIANGAQLSDEQTAQVVDYLAKTYGTN